MEEILEKVRAQVKPQYSKVKCWPHGWLHIRKVVESAKKIAEMERVDPVLCQIAAYCHDLGRIEEEKRGLVNPIAGSPSAHATLSARPTKKVLDNIGIVGQDAEDIIEAVRIHNIRKYRGNNKIALILQDADRTSGFGKLGVLRLATFNCELDIPKPKGEKHIDISIKKVKADPLHHAS